MAKATINGLRALLDRQFPEQRIFLKSDRETRFVRLGGGAQLAAWLGSSAILSWTIIATAVLLMDQIGSGNLRDQALRDQEIYEARLEALAQERDARAVEAAAAQERFNAALAQVSAMQSHLLAAEGRLMELETGTGVIQATLRRAISERDTAAAEAERLASELAGDVTPIIAAADDGAATVDVLTAALAGTAAERDAAAIEAEAAYGERAALENEIHLMRERNEEIFAQLEEAIDISVEPLEKMFRSAGMDPDQMIEQVRRGYTGQGGPLEPIVSTSGAGGLDPDAARANGILDTLDEMNLYRIAAQKAPFANPVPSGNYRQTSAFGHRSDPFGKGRRMHSGLDFAGAKGTPIHVTADGTVVRAGNMSGYGKSIDVKHAFGLMTRYAHLSEIDVKAGQSLSRGDRIGAMGSTGRSTGTHLHYEVHSGGAAMDPMTYLKAARDVF